MRHVYALWLLVILLGGASLYAVYQVQNVLAHENDTLSALICHAEHAVRTTPNITEQQRRQALRFYEQQIKLEHLKPCTTP